MVSIKPSPQYQTSFFKSWATPVHSSNSLIMANPHSPLDVQNTWEKMNKAVEDINQIYRQALEREAQCQQREAQSQRREKELQITIAVINAQIVVLQTQLNNLKRKLTKMFTDLP